ncbi:DUF4091 domain-containing protein [Amnibacterium sp. CER49]|uniref:DUF4091 domain-containing protein n=1 Tax=Amnibacterium sp. CER49 TaxID=3039161 RepID=UPI00244938D9|nr:DUF4091 domain-containing protein [Amnibacterium sp. CER49]MDH2442564.1 DUF4091 domain-containing protein [Amnibacterium sp. CER49]
MTTEPVGAGSWDIAVVNSLVKVHPDYAPRASDRDLYLSTTLGEPVSFQVAVRPPATGHFQPQETLHVSVEPGDGARATIQTVELVPNDLPSFRQHDDGYERDEPGLYPDLLRLAPDGLFRPLLAGWSAVWIDIQVDDPQHAGDRHIQVELTRGDTVLLSATLELFVAPVTLAPLSIVNTAWLWLQSIAEYHGVEVFSEPHWHLIDRAVAAASHAQINSLLTSVWTPPLETEVGARLLTTQLVDIHRVGGRYRFDFAKLKRWVEICRRHGIVHLEIAHLFTQWGAHATPSIWVSVDGALTEEFGWHVPAVDPGYRRFLEAFIPALTTFLEQNWSLSNVLFHLSDEPEGESGLAGYRAAREVVGELLEGFTVVDALSDVELFDEGLIECPVVATDAVMPFLERAVPNLWIYYCVGQARDVANRFMALPSSRNRVLGHQLFAFGCGGFLHWGFNFYSTRLSRARLDPYANTTAGGAYPGGDAFLVYPGMDGEPEASIRSRVFAQAMYDHRALTMLAALGDTGARELIDTDGDGGALRFDKFSYDDGHYLRARAEVNARLSALEGVAR